MAPAAQGCSGIKSACELGNHGNWSGDFIIRCLRKGFRCHRGDTGTVGYCIYELPPLSLTIKPFLLSSITGARVSLPPIDNLNGPMIIVIIGFVITLYCLISKTGLLLHSAIGVIDIASSSPVYDPEKHIPTPHRFKSKSLLIIDSFFLTRVPTPLVVIIIPPLLLNYIFR